MPVGERIANVWHEAQRELLRASRPEFERRQRLPGVAFRQAQEFQRVVRRLERDDCGFAFGRHWQKFETRSRYDAECALRTDQQIAKIVAGVVLFQPSQPVPDAPVGEHRLESKRQISRIAVGEHGRAPGVRREHAADHGAAFRSEAQREQAVGFLRRHSALRVASRRLRRSSCRPPRRYRERSAVGRATAQFRCPLATEFGRRQDRYCRLAGRCRCRARWPAPESATPLPSIRGAAPPASCPYSGRAIRAGRGLDHRRASTHALRRRSRRNVQSNLRECSSGARDLPTAN